MMDKMKAVVLNRAGHLDSLRLQEVPVPQPGEGQALVKIRASALNHRDVWIVKGLYAKIRVPVILGSDGSGMVVGVGSAGDEKWLNQSVVINPALDWGENTAVQQDKFRILGMPDEGTQAEYIIVPVTNIYRKPDYLDFQQAAALPLAGLTGYRALFTRGMLKAGETLLLTGIGGGVARLMLDLARAAGASVWVTSGDDRKVESAISAGATGGANYTHPDWREKLASELGESGIDLIVDSAGGEGFLGLIELVKPGGKIVILGATAGIPSQVNLRRIFWKQITIQGTTMGSPDDFQMMLRFCEKNKIRPAVDSVYPLTEYLSAYQRMMTGKQSGKIVMHH